MKLGFIGLGIMGTPMAINLHVLVINCMSQPLVRLLMNYCHWAPLVLKLRAR